MSAVDVRSDKLGRLVDENVEVNQLGTGFTFTEGPVWNPQGQFLLFSDMPGDTRRRWDEQGGVEVVASPREMRRRSAHWTIGVPRYARIAPMRNGVSTGPR